MLREHELLKGSTSEQPALLIVGCVKTARFKPGEFLLREGTPPTCSILLRTGDVALEIHVPGRRPPIVIEQLGPGDMLGLVVAGPATYRVELRRTRRRTGAWRSRSTAHAFATRCEENHDPGYEFLKRFSSSSDLAD